MAQSRRRYARKRTSPFKKLVIALLIIAASGAAVYFAVSYFGKAQNLIENALYPVKYSEYVDKAAEEYDLEKPLIYAVIHTESHFNEKAESSAGAVGLMQVTPETYDWLAGLRGEETVENGLKKPKINIDYGCYLIRYLFDTYGDETAVVAAYNAGITKVGEWLKDPSISPDGKTLKNIPYEETKHYVEKVEKAKKTYKKLYFS